MAPSPAYLSYAERIILAAIRKHEEAMDKGYIGGTIYRSICDALVDAGLLEQPNRLEHNHFTPDVRPDDCPICATYPEIVGDI